MTNGEKAHQIACKYARQYHHNSYPEQSKNSEFVFSNEEIEKACNEMAEWKERQLLEVCEICEQKSIRNGHLGCAFRSLENTYCWRK